MTLLDQYTKYDDIITNIETDISYINEGVQNLSKLLFDDSFQYFGKTVVFESEHNSKPSCTANPWFDNTCKTEKQNFNRAKHTYARCRSDQNRINLTRCRTSLNKAKRRAQAIYKFEKGKRVQNLARTNPKQFWKEIKKVNGRKRKLSDKLSSDDFLEHFSNVFKIPTENINADPFDENFGDTSDEMLDRPISEEELRKVILTLKSNKSPGIDGLIAEIFKCSFDCMSPLLLRLFNIIFLKGIYPASWSEGVIAPIHKKGSLDETNNYRGITLINTLSKIYSHILNNRLLNWASENNKISDCQFGFQKNKSTIDCIFIFHSIISKILDNKEKLYCCFIDYQKAFDSVNRSFLWQKLLRNGCSKIMLKALYAMYQSVKSCVRYKGKCSNFFNTDTGVKQGDPLSPVLFIFFINDIIDNTTDDNDELLTINEINIFMLMYADDAVFFTKSAQTLQNMLHKLQAYSNEWGLKINTDKTKIMIFEKGRRSEVHFHYNNIELEVVDSFKYLGIMFYKNGSWNRTQKCLAEYGSFALHNLYRLLQDMNLKTNEKFKLFDCLVSSVLGYAGEVWGFHGAPDIERLHTQFCRSLLGVKKSTNLAALYCELGRKPLILFRKIRILKYWWKVIESGDTLIKNVYNLLYDDVLNGRTYNTSNWAYQVKHILDSLGFSHIWNNQAIDNITFQEIKQRLFDHANQDLMMSINTSPKLQSYCIFKENSQLEPYIDAIKQTKYRFALSRLRLSSHSLAIETGRYTGIPRSERICTFCNMNVVENEFHFLLSCPHYINLRRKYLPAYYCSWPSLHKLKSIFQTNSKTLINNLSKYVHFAFKQRVIGPP